MKQYTKLKDKDMLQLIIHGNNRTELRDYNEGSSISVRKSKEDEFDTEKAVLYLLAKMHGYTVSDINYLIKNVTFSHEAIKEGFGNKFDK